MSARLPADLVRVTVAALWAPAPLPCGPLCLRLDLSPMRGPAQRLTDIAVMSELRGLLWVALGFRPGAPDVRHQKEFL